MKKLWIGTGIIIYIIIIGNIIAQKLVPDRALPISVFAACLCLCIPMLLTAVWICICAIEEIKECNRKGKLEEVYAVRWEAQSKYGFLEDKYIVCYFENLKILHELKMVEPPVDTDETD